jgi:hypothetical protein
MVVAVEMAVSVLGEIPEMMANRDLFVAKISSTERNSLALLKSNATTDQIVPRQPSPEEGSTISLIRNAKSRSAADVLLSIWVWRAMIIK